MKKLFFLLVFGMFSTLCFSTVTDTAPKTTKKESISFVSPTIVLQETIQSPSLELNYLFENNILIKPDWPKENLNTFYVNIEKPTNIESVCSYINKYKHCNSFSPVCLNNSSYISKTKYDLIQRDLLFLVRIYPTKSKWQNCLNLPKLS